MSARTSHIHNALICAAFLAISACGGGGEEGSATGGTGSGGGTPGTGSGNGSGSGSATLSWMPPTENTDGTTVAGLAGYHIYSGTNRNQLALSRSIASPGITTVVLDGLAAGTHYFAVSAYLTSGAESDPSAVGSKTVP